MSARYTRDEILSRALDLVNSSTLSNHDRPGGVISSNAYAIQWLQDGLDKYHTQYPFSGDLTDVGVSFTPNQRYLTITSTGLAIPTDFSVDARNGLYLYDGAGYRRLFRKSFQDWLPTYTQSLGRVAQFPSVYCKFQGKINVAPVFSGTYTGTLWYFSRPPVLTASDFPAFPDETVLIEYVRIKGLEWTKQYPPGTCEAYFMKALGRLKMAGLLDEPEYDVFPIEQSLMTDYNVPGVFSWLGQIGPVLS